MVTSQGKPGCIIVQRRIFKISEEFATKARELFGDKLKETILFGSFARGGATDESDIDIMLLIEMDRAELKEYRSGVCAASSELGIKYGIMISPVIQGIDEFNKYKDDLPFFRNISLEGVKIVQK